MHVARFFRDPIYLGGLAALAAVFVVALVLGMSRGGSSASASVATPNPTALATATEAAAAPTPIAVRTPQLYEVLLDARRVLDLAALQDALAVYHQRFGSYPSTEGVAQSVCGANGDAGCALSSVNGKLSYNDGSDDYLYTSDGSTFMLATRLQTAVSPDGCAGSAPLALAGLPVYCLAPKGKH
jgi:hypothetical protein